MKYLKKGWGGGASADLRQEFAQAATSTSFQDRLMKFSGLALGTVLYILNSHSQLAKTTSESKTAIS